MVGGKKDVVRYTMLIFILDEANFYSQLHIGQDLAGKSNGMSSVLVCIFPHPSFTSMPTKEFRLTPPTVGVSSSFKTK